MSRSTGVAGQVAAGQLGQLMYRWTTPDQEHKVGDSASAPQ